MASSKCKRLRVSEVPAVLYVRVSTKALRRAVGGRVLYRANGKPLVLYGRRRHAQQRATDARLVLRVAARASAAAGAKIYNGTPGRYETDSISIQFVSCTKLPYVIRNVPVIDAAGGIVVAGKRARVLLLRKRNGRRSQWVLPKGKRERKEARRRAARREVLEESGLARVDVGPYLMRERYFDIEGGRVVFKEVSYYLMRCPEGKTALKVNGAEGFVEGKWMSFDAACAATNPVRSHRSLRKARAAIRAK
jgi:8-oxo-dGTP pyrophosphatase MutT (NUDIX family)